MTIEPLLLTTTLVKTYEGEKPLTNASGFFFENEGKLFLVTSMHVLFDSNSKHHPDHLLIEFHVDLSNITRTVDYFIPLYVQGKSQWIQGSDASGEIDVAVIEIDKNALPKDVIYRNFRIENLPADFNEIEIGTQLLIVGYPLGFHDTFHHLPVVRHAVNASSFRMRFQGNGYFLTDARTHQGSSGAAIVTRSENRELKDLPWQLLGIHSARFDINSRDTEVDEALGLNCAWFADILLTLTSSRQFHEMPQIIQ